VDAMISDISTRECVCELVSHEDKDEKEVVKGNNDDEDFLGYF
jgi:hypothetical protein